jgi:uncharacterized protein (DUF2126 family)/transglutaminase-like putative cysteine protease
MGVQVALNHRTNYRYEKATALGPQIIRLHPAPHCRVPILHYSLDVTPADRLLNWQTDLHSNRFARLLFPQNPTEFNVEVNLIADLCAVNPFDFFLEPGVEQYPFSYPPALTKDLEPFRWVDLPGPFLRAFLAGLDGGTCGTITFLLNLNRKVRDEIAYVTRLAPGLQSSEETLEKRSGSCRDSAWLLVECLRNLGIAARFVSGYLVQLATDGSSPAVDGPNADSADLHAWAEVYLPGAGWIGLDATSGLVAGAGHIPLACTPTALQAAPIEGTAALPSTDFSYSMSVRRLNESRRPSNPLSDREWACVRQLAHTVDLELKAQDIRLTMGGEPTFVGIDAPESPQWNIEALGDVKRRCGMGLIQALRARMAPGALLHYGQGKWYPGEPLPRWSLSCFWRKDGVPVWEDLRFIAAEDQDYGFRAVDAFRFIEALARRLQVNPENVLAAFSPDSEPAEPAGYILPIRRRQPGGRLRWSSQLWFARPERLTLFPGDSPIGFRIPTESMPWVAPDELEYEHESAPFQDRVKLPALPGRHMELFDVAPEVDPLPPFLRAPDDVPELIRPSLCVEARAGRIHVFLPYAPVLADFLDMVSAVEDTCRFLNMPVWVEGYAPPFDTRMRSFSVTPDPGVLEVNLPPAATWDELEDIHTILHEEARRNRLTAEKFDNNGAHNATGGGSHIVIGGATIRDSPILRRPDLLRSMLAFWQNHPSLSFLFSGTYVGPTSQYPRVDEARMDALYELELAFDQIPQSDCQPETVDALFRNLLADVTGNTHRAEFCVDKLFPPQGLGLQLGLLELRAFEMPPHVRMSLLQMLLIRALVCMFWKSPFEGRLIRWGAALHDRFMLPYFVRRDLAEVLARLRHSGFDFEEEWFASQLEFRFPKIGAVTAGGIELELRRALEPWNVLAEETVSGRPVRSVDSSLERIQVKLSGVTAESRYVVSCNRRRVPLKPAVEPGVLIAGVRYRARKLSAALHPTVPVHAPLVFDLIDCWMQQCIARCTYHVDPSDGRRYETRPVNVAEAEGRRLERFQVASPSHSPVEIPEIELNPTFPGTLDLRIPPPVSWNRTERREFLS